MKKKIVPNDYYMYLLTCNW